MTILIAVDGGEGITLTDEHAASSYGQLVLADDQVRALIAETDAIGKLRVFAGGG